MVTCLGETGGSLFFCVHEKPWHITNSAFNKKPGRSGTSESSPSPSPLFSPVSSWSWPPKLPHVHSFYTPGNIRTFAWSMFLFTPPQPHQVQQNIISKSWLWTTSGEQSFSGSNGSIESPLGPWPKAPAPLYHPHLPWWGQQQNHHLKIPHSLSSWWLKQPTHLKKYAQSSNWINDFPNFRGVKIQKNIWKFHHLVIRLKLTSLHLVSLTSLCFCWHHKGWKWQVRLCLSVPSFGMEIPSMSNPSNGEPSTAQKKWTNPKPTQWGPWS